MDPEFNGPSITDDDYSGCGAHTFACLGPRAAAVLSSEMSHGTSPIGDPHFTHAMLNSVCDGMDAEAHEITKVVIYMIVAAAQEQHVIRKTG